MSDADSSLLLLGPCPSNRGRRFAPARLVQPLLATSTDFGTNVRELLGRRSPWAANPRAFPQRFDAINGTGGLSPMKSDPDARRYSASRALGLPSSPPQDWRCVYPLNTLYLSGQLSPDPAVLVVHLMLIREPETVASGRQKCPLQGVIRPCRGRAALSGN